MDRFLKYTQISDLIKICVVAAEFFHAYEQWQTDLTKLIFVFRYLRARLTIWDPSLRQHNPARTHHKDNSHHVNTVHEAESHLVREKPEGDLLRSKRIVLKTI